MAKRSEENLEEKEEVVKNMEEQVEEKEEVKPEQEAEVKAEQEVEAKEENMEDNKQEDIENKEENMETDKEDIEEEKPEEEDTEEKEDVENKEEDMEDKEEDIEEEKEVDYEAKIAEMESKIAEMEEDKKVYMQELEELRAYKAEREESDKNFAIEQVFAQIKDIIPNEKMDELREEAKTIEFSAIDGFNNKVKALAFEYTSTKEDVVSNRMAIVNIESQQSRKPFEWYE